MQVQTVPGAPIAAYPGTYPAAQTQVAVMPQATQQSVMVPSQQLANSQQVMYAAPGAMVPQAVQPDPTPLMSVPTPQGVPPGALVAGQTDPNTMQYGIPAMQQIVSNINALELQMYVYKLESNPPHMIPLHTH